MDLPFFKKHSFKVRQLQATLLHANEKAMDKGTVWYSELQKRLEQSMRLLAEQQRKLRERLAANVESFKRIVHEFAVLVTQLENVYIAQLNEQARVAGVKLNEKVASVLMLTNQRDAVIFNIFHVTEQMKALKRENSDLQQMVAQSETDASKLSSQINEKSNMIADLEQKAHVMTQNQADLERRISTLTETLGSSDMNSIKLNEEKIKMNNEAVAKIEDLQAIVTVLKEKERASLEAFNAKINNLQSEFEVIQQKLKEAEDTVTLSKLATQRDNLREVGVQATLQMESEILNTSKNISEIGKQVKTETKKLGKVNHHVVKIEDTELSIWVNRLVYSVIGTKESKRDEVAREINILRLHGWNSPELRNYEDKYVQMAKTPQQTEERKRQVLQQRARKRI